MIKITWYGHAAFKIESSEVSFILDPYRYPDAGGYLPIDDSADAVCISHINDRYHSHTGQIKPGFELLDAQKFASGGVEFRGVRLQSIPVYETPEKLAGDEVTIIYFTLDGIKIVFLSDLGHALTSEELAPIADADILFASTGGKPTIALDELMVLIDQIKPRLVIPMHFKTDKINLNILPNEAFLELAKPVYPVHHAGSATVSISKDLLPKTTQVLVLDHLR